MQDILQKLNTSLELRDCFACSLPQFTVNILDLELQNIIPELERLSAKEFYPYDTGVVLYQLSYQTTLYLLQQPKFVQKV